MSVAVEGDASTVREREREGELFSSNLDANSSSEDFETPRSRTRSFSSIWKTDVDHHRHESLPLHSLQQEYLSLMSQ